jgi:hypothetical protein
VALSSSYDTFGITLQTQKTGGCWPAFYKGGKKLIF